MKNRTALFLLATLSSALAIHPALHGAVLTSGGITTVASGGMAPGTRTDFDFFGGGTQPIDLADFTLTTPSPDQFNAAGSNVTYSSVQPPGGGTVFSTGISQPLNGASTTPYTANLATFTLNANEGTNRSFGVYVLFGNTDGVHVFDASISLSINGGTTLTVPVTDTTETNDFLRFNVSGLNAGDTLTVSAMDSALDAQGSNSNKPYIGGVTFMVPEPSTWSLMLSGVGLFGLSMLRRMMASPRASKHLREIKCIRFPFFLVCAAAEGRGDAGRAFQSSHQMTNLVKRQTNALVIILVFLVVMADIRPAAAQNQFYPTNATINSFINGNVYVGYANQSDYQNGVNGTSPTVGLYAGGSVGGTLYTFNGSILNVAGPTGGSDLISEDVSMMNISSGKVAQFTADGSSTIDLIGGTVVNFARAVNSGTVNVSGGQINGAGLTLNNTAFASITGGTITGVLAGNSSRVIIAGGTFGPLIDLPNVNFFDQTKGAFTFVGTGLTATSLGTDANVGGTDYALGGLLQSGQTLTGDVINVQPAATMFTFSDGSVVPESGSWALVGLSGAVLLVGRRWRPRGESVRE